MSNLSESNGNGNGKTWRLLVGLCVTSLIAAIILGAVGLTSLLRRVEVLENKLDISAESRALGYQRLSSVESQLSELRRRMDKSPY